MTELWLGADHYKWRVMRSNGVDEYFISGDAPDEEKFHAFAKALPNCIGNPMYHWCHLELQRYFGINETLSEKNWKEIYDKCNEILQKPEMSAKNLIRMSGVTLVCTTDDPIDDLHYHEQIAADSDFDVQVLPAWHQDLAMSPEKEGFVSYIQKLGEVSGVTITDFTTLKEALVKRLDLAREAVWFLWTTGLDYAEFCPLSEEEENALVKKSLAGETLTEEELKQYRTICMLFLRCWVQKEKLGHPASLSCGSARMMNWYLRVPVPTPESTALIQKDLLLKLQDFMNALNREGNLKQLFTP